MKRARIPDTVPNAADNASQLLFAIMFDDDHLGYLPDPIASPHPLSNRRRGDANILFESRFRVVGQHDRADFHLGAGLEA